MPIQKQVLRTAGSVRSSSALPAAAFALQSLMPVIVGSLAGRADNSEDHVRARSKRCETEKTTRDCQKHH